MTQHDSRDPEDLEEEPLSLTLALPLSLSLPWASVVVVNDPGACFTVTLTMFGDRVSDTVSACPFVRMTTVNGLTIGLWVTV